MAAKLRAVFFDFGGTLFSYGVWREKGFAVVAEQLQALGIEAAPREILGAYAKASGAAFRKYMPQPYYLHADLFRDSFLGVAEHFEVSADEAAVEAFLEAQRQMMLTHVVLRDDCHETLAALRAQGLTLSIVSNIDDDYLLPMVERLGLAPLLDHWLSSEEAQSCKPDPGFFELAMERASCEAGEVLFVGDSVEADIAGGRGVGMQTALISEGTMAAPGAGTGPAAEPHFRITALSELVGIADSLR